MLVLYLPFFLVFRSLSTKYLVSCLILVVSQHFLKNKFFCFLWTFNLIVVYSLLTKKKTPCSNFHFDRVHSNTYVSRVFFYLLTLFMFPLLFVYPPDVPSLFVHPPHCYSPFFLSLLFSLPNTSFKKTKKKLFSPCYCCKTFMSLFSFLCHFLFSSLSVKTPSASSSLFWFRLFSLLHFQFCSFEK